MNSSSRDKLKGWYDTDHDKVVTVGVGVECLVGYVTPSKNSKTTSEKLDPWAGYQIKTTLNDREVRGLGETRPDDRPLLIINMDNSEDINSTDDEKRGKSHAKVEFLMLNALKDEWEQTRLSGPRDEIVRKVVTRDKLSVKNETAKLSEEKPEKMEDHSLWKDTFIVKPAPSVWEADIQVRDSTKTGQIGSAVRSMEAYRAWHFRGIKVNSPIYEGQDSNFPAGEDSLEEHIVCLRLGHRLKINTSCSLHVHVGLADGSSFSKITLKKLGTILWLAEDRLEMLTSPEIRERAGYRPLTKFSRLAQRDAEAMRRLQNCSDADYVKWLELALSPHNPLSGGTGMVDKQRIEESLRLLWMADTADDVRFLLEDPHPSQGRYPYDFQTRPSQYPKKTVEFRMMEGTLDPDLIGKWAKLCYEIVNFSRLCSHQKFFYVAKNLLKECDPARLRNHKNKNATSFTLWDFLGKNGVNIPDSYRKYWEWRVDDDECSNSNDHDDRWKERTAVDTAFNHLKEYRGDFVPDDVPQWHKED